MSKGTASNDADHSTASLGATSLLPDIADGYAHHLKVVTQDVFAWQSLDRMDLALLLTAAGRH